MNILSFIVNLDTNFLNLKDLSIISCVSKSCYETCKKTKLMNYKIVDIKNNKIYRNIVRKTFILDSINKTTFNYNILNNIYIIYCLLDYKNNIISCIFFIYKNNMLFLNKIYNNYSSFIKYENMIIYTDIFIKKSINNILYNKIYSDIWILCHNNNKEHYLKLGFKEDFIIKFIKSYSNNINKNKNLLYYNLSFKDKLKKFLKIL